MRQERGRSGSALPVQTCTARVSPLWGSVAWHTPSGRLREAQRWPRSSQVPCVSWLWCHDLRIRQIHKCPWHGTRLRESLETRLGSVFGFPLFHSRVDGRSLSFEMVKEEQGVAYLILHSSAHHHQRFWLVLFLQCPREGGVIRLFSNAEAKGPRSVWVLTSMPKALQHIGAFQTSMASVLEERGAVGGVETITCRSPEHVVECLWAYFHW